MEKALKKMRNYAIISMIIGVIGAIFAVTFFHPINTYSAIAYYAIGILIGMALGLPIVEEEIKSELKKEQSSKSNTTKEEINAKNLVN
jgi:hypothetical protein